MKRLFFIFLVRQHAPNLTQGEKRICAYLRIGLDNKQIAEVLSIQASGVKIARYRLREKLRLSTEQSLEQYIIDITSDKSQEMNQ